MLSVLIYYSITTFLMTFILMYIIYDVNKDFKQFKIAGTFYLVTSMIIIIDLLFSINIYAYLLFPIAFANTVLIPFYVYKYSKLNK